jgi:hypothetical protein
MEAKVFDQVRFIYYCLDYEVYGIRWHLLYALLYHVIAILIIYTLYYIIPQLLH